jgi:hypothetical protein
MERQPMLVDRFEVSAACDKRNVNAGAMKHQADIAANGAGPVNANLHNIFSETEERTGEFELTG